MENGELTNKDAYPAKQVVGAGLHSQTWTAGLGYSGIIENYANRQNAESSNARVPNQGLSGLTANFLGFYWTPFRRTIGCLVLKSLEQIIAQ